jgi:DNA invertase Pin-like site-specific DNA recombinase
MNRVPDLAVIAYSYIRFSTPEQAKGDSLRRQTEMAEAYCRRRGWTLDTSLTLSDLGVSAFRGDNALVGNLRTFLDAIKSKKVLPGSVLIVESIDRISRQGIDEGYDLIKGILKAGIILVTLSPEREFDVSATKSLSKGALEIQLILERAAEESERKSVRLGAAWSKKRERARGNGDVLTHQLPAWIEERNGRLQLIPACAAAVRRIFEMAANGYGHKLTVATFVQDAVPPMKDGMAWNASYIGYILKDRRAVGEFQPCSRGKPIGEPMSGYYPAVVTEEAWLRARAGAAQRRQSRGRRGGHVNLFTHLAKDALGGSSYISSLRPPSGGRGCAQRVLVNADYSAGIAQCRSFPLDTFERAILSKLKELDPRELLGDDGAPSEMLNLDGELAGVEAELSDAAAFMESHGFSPTIGKRVTDLEARKRTLEVKLVEARAKASHSLNQTWDEAKTLADLLDAAPDPQDTRLRLRAALRRVIDSIWLLVVPLGRDRVCAAQVWFAGGEKHRDYVILHRATKANGRKRTPGGWCVRSLASIAVTGDLDLRKPGDAAKLTGKLEQIELAGLRAALEADGAGE